MILNNFLKGEDFIKQNKIYQEFGKVLISKIILIDANSKEVVNIAEINNYNFNCDLPHFIKQFNHILSDSDEIDLSLPADPNLINKDLALLVFGFDDVKINNGNIIEQADLLLSSVALPKLPAKYFTESTGVNFNIIFSIENKSAKFQLFKDEQTCSSKVVDSPTVYNIERCDCTDDPCIPDTVNIEMGSKEVDLSDYYVKAEVDSLLDNKANKKDLELKINKIDTLKFVDKEYLNKVLQDFDPLAAIKPELDNIKLQMSKISRPEVELDDYYTKSETFNKSEINTKLKLLKDDINNINTTLEDVKVKAESKLEIPEIDTSSFAKKSDVYNKIEIDSKISGIKVDPDQLKTKFYTKPEIDTKIKNLNDSTSSNLANYYSKSEIDLKLKNHKGSGGSIDAYTKLETDQKISEATINTNKKFEDYYNKEQVESKIEGALESNNVTLSNYYKKTETYNKNEVDSRIKELAPKPEVDLTNYYDKDHIDIELNKKANKVDVYSKNETYNRDEIDNKIIAPYWPFNRYKLDHSYHSGLNSYIGRYISTQKYTLFWGSGSISASPNDKNGNSISGELTHQSMIGHEGNFYFAECPQYSGSDGVVYWITDYHHEKCAVEVCMIWFSINLYRGELTQKGHGKFILNQFNEHSGIEMGKDYIICGGEMIIFAPSSEYGSTEIVEVSRKPLLNPKMLPGCVFKKIGHNYAIISTPKQSIAKLVKYKGDIDSRIGDSRIEIIDVAEFPNMFMRDLKMESKEYDNKIYIYPHINYFDRSLEGSVLDFDQHKHMSNILSSFRSVQLLYDRLYNVAKFLDPTVSIFKGIPKEHFTLNIEYFYDMQALCHPKYSKDFDFEDVKKILIERVGEDNYQEILDSFDLEVGDYTKNLFQNIATKIYKLDEEHAQKFVEYALNENEVIYKDGQYVTTQNKLLDVLRDSYTNEYSLYKIGIGSNDPRDIALFSPRTAVDILKSTKFFGELDIERYMNDVYYSNEYKDYLKNLDDYKEVGEGVRQLKGRMGVYSYIPLIQIDLKTNKILLKTIRPSFFDENAFMLDIEFEGYSLGYSIYTHNYVYRCRDISSLFASNCTEIQRKDCETTTKYTVVRGLEGPEPGYRTNERGLTLALDNDAIGEIRDIRDGDEITIKKSPTKLIVTHNKEPLIVKKPSYYVEKYTSLNPFLTDSSFSLQQFKEDSGIIWSNKLKSCVFLSDDHKKDSDLLQGGLMSHTLAYKWLKLSTDETDIQNLRFDKSEIRSLGGTQPSPQYFASDMTPWGYLNISRDPHQNKIFKLGPALFPKILWPHMHDIQDIAKKIDNSNELITECANKLSSILNNYKIGDCYLLFSNLSMFGTQEKITKTTYAYILDLIEAVNMTYIKSKLESYWDNMPAGDVKNDVATLSDPSAWGDVVDEGDANSFLPFSLSEFEDFILQMNQKIGEALLESGHESLLSILYKDISKFKPLIEIIGGTKFEDFLVKVGEESKISLHFNKNEIESNFDKYVNEIKAKDPSFKMSQKDKNLILDFLSLTENQQKAILF